MVSAPGGEFNRVRRVRVRVDGMVATGHAADRDHLRGDRTRDTEAVALAGGPNARRWIDELRHVRLEITGDDLLAAGVTEGPQVGARLARTLDQVLDGVVTGRDAQLTAALAPLE